MKVVLAGAYGNLGADIFRKLIRESCIQPVLILMKTIRFLPFQPAATILRMQDSLLLHDFSERAKA